MTNILDRRYRFQPYLEDDEENSDNEGSVNNETESEGENSLNSEQELRQEILEFIIVNKDKKDQDGGGNNEWRLNKIIENIHKLELEEEGKLNLDEVPNLIQELRDSKENAASMMKVILNYIDMGDLKSYLDPNEGMTNLILAIQYRHPEVAKILIERNFNIHMVDDEYYKTPLFYCLREGFIDVAKLLIDKGVNIDEQDLNNNTPLIYFIKSKVGMLDDVNKPYIVNRDQYVTKFLIENGASISKLDGYNKSALEYIIENEEKEIASLIVIKSKEVSNLTIDQLYKLINCCLHNIGYDKLEYLKSKESFKDFIKEVFCILFEKEDLKELFRSTENLNFERIDSMNKPYFLYAVLEKIFPLLKVADIVNEEERKVQLDKYRQEVEDFKLGKSILYSELQSKILKESCKLIFDKELHELSDEQKKETSEYVNIVNHENLRDNILFYCSIFKVYDLDFSEKNDSIVDLLYKHTIYQTITQQPNNQLTSDDTYKILNYPEKLNYVFDTQTFKKSLCERGLLSDQDRDNKRKISVITEDLDISCPSTSKRLKLG